MLIVLEDSKIKAVDKSLLQLLNLNLIEISTIIEELQLKLSALTNKTININNKELSVKEIELLSIENIEVFELTLLDKSSFLDGTKQQDIKEISINKQTENIQIPSINPIKEDFSNISPLNPIDNTPPSQIQQESISPLEKNIHDEPISPIQPSISPNIEVNEKESDTSEISPISPTLKENFNEVSSIPSQEENINNSSQQMDFENLSLNLEGGLELEFEDTKDELYQILENKEEILNSIQRELKDAQQDLGIDKELANELFEELIQQIEDEKSDIYQNLNNRDHEKLHRNYHKLKGAALNLRLQNLALILKNLDELSKMRENIHTLRDITDKFYQIVDYIKNNQKSSIDIEAIKRKLSSNPILKKYVLTTIKSYFESNSEIAFEKTKTYLEKLLKVKILSPEDLKTIMKGIQ